MSLAVSLIVVTVVAAAIRKPLKAAPWVFYLLSLLFAITALYLTVSPVPNTLVRSIVYAVQKGQVAFSLFALVMFVGVFDTESKVRSFLGPVRAELSISATLLLCGHFPLYASSYFGTGLQVLARRPSVLASLLIAAILCILVALLAITSINKVKRHMRSGTWKRLQALSYAFFALIYFHMLGYFIVPALEGSTTSAVNLGVYTAVFSAYVVLRIRKALRDRHLNILKCRDTETFRTHAQQ
ncbi:MAG: hypothetical protein LBL86_09125 [Coriobacteriales bacterium]|jgi:DMSO/TMAO reductase YedYZ heme-binding membrane subunit|nr:hypothetical protein [Coriobacteriales bacterium]